MPELATIPLPRRPDLVLRPLGKDGQHVVKDPLTGARYRLGEQESFLFLRLDGEQSTRDICEAFERRFGQPLSEEDLQGFLELAQAEGFLQTPGPSGTDPEGPGVWPLRIVLFSPGPGPGLPVDVGPLYSSTSPEPDPAPDLSPGPLPCQGRGLGEGLEEQRVPVPGRRPELVIRPLGDDGQHVVKDPATRAYFRLGEQESFLLLQLDGEQTAAEVCRAFERKFGQPLSEEDLQGFLDLARAQGFLRPAQAPAEAPPVEDAVVRAERIPAPAVAELSASSATTRPAPPRARQSILYWRKSFFDPDRLMTWLAPKLGFLWTRTFLFLSLGCILLAAVSVWVNREEVVTSFVRAWRWETVFVAWLALAAVTTCHEFAHGLTCKRYGGEVHEVGFLLMFFIPCFYCNVSDAWLFREKSKRLLVTLAGGYCDLVLWALAVFVWRLADPASLVNYFAWVVLTVCGARVFFNFNPLLKLDGYYLLSDWLEVPNLRQRAWGYVAGHLRWLLWGAPRPAREPRGKFLLTYGVCSWLFSMMYLVLMLVLFYHLLGSRWGLVGGAGVALLGLMTLPGMFQGLGGGEVKQMLRLRWKRTAVWLLILGGIPAALVLVEVEERASGPFQVRGAARVELRAPVAGFLKTIHFDEGDRVSSGVLLAQLEVPDLASRLARKQAEVRESQARLLMLEVGPRKEVIDEQRQRVARALKWRALGAQDLKRSQEAYKEEMARLDRLIAQYAAELDFAEKSLARLKKAGNVFTPEELELAEKKGQVHQAQLQQARAHKQARQALGTLEAEAELARRDKDWADARSVLTLLEAGTRPEEIDAERARLARLQEEARYLQEWQDRLRVCTTSAGLVMTPRLREKVGQYLKEGDLICVIEEPGGLEAEIAVPEQDVARVQSGQPVSLKARGFPFETLSGQVERVGAGAVGPEATPLAPTLRGEVAGTVTVYCRLRDPPPGLRPGMTGYARVECGPRSLGGFLAERVMRFLRTEFWW
ncbi:MAG: HlyD family efflux transporter periplasmic adaptor subunit [Gemmataceae bacterium]|nr:HlyD family efflux transporter periplasmic adaptor subunit [Gemmataceae bacterium]